MMEQVTMMNTSVNPIRIQLIEDVLISEAGLRYLLERETDFVILEHARCDTLCRQACISHNPDIILMVIKSGSLCGLECISKITRNHPDCHILVLCMVDDPYIARRLLDQGVRGVLCGHTPPDILIRAVRKVAAGDVYIDTEIARKVAMLNINDEPSPFTCLTLREHEIARLMLNGFNQKEIAEKLFINERTVANHHSHILHKLNVNNNIELTKLAIKYNIIQL